MNDTQTPGGSADSQTGAPGAQSGPRVTREQIADTERLRRSSTDRYVAGVAGGVARHLDIDPILVRVAFVALTFVGGAGLLLYCALWLLVPRDDDAQSLITLGPDSRRIALICALAVTGLIALGDLFSGNHWFAWPLAMVALVVELVVMNRGDRRPSTDAARAAAASDTGTTQTVAAPGAPAAAAPGTPTSAPTSGAGGGAGRGGDETGEWPPPRRPAKPRRTGMVLFWPTLALIAVGVGSLALYDADHAVADGAYPALALAIIGAMLVLGAFVARSGGLILLGLLTIPPLLVSSLIGNTWEGQGTDRTARPLTAAQVESSYHFSTGRLELDLTELSPAQVKALDGRRITIDMNAGDVLVRLPETLDYDVDAHLSLGGQIEADGRTASGPAPSLTQGHDDGGPQIDLELAGKAGRFTVLTGDAAAPEHFDEFDDDGVLDRD